MVKHINPLGARVNRGLTALAAMPVGEGFFRVFIEVAVVRAVRRNHPIGLRGEHHMRRLGRRGKG